MDTYDLWIEKGYEHFANYGPKDLSIKLIAEECSMTRTTFHYHFLNKEEFIEELLDIHLELLNQYCALGKLNCNKFLPDIHELGMSFPNGIKFQKQLFNFRHIKKFDVIYQRCNRIAAESFIVQHFIAFYDLPLSFKPASVLYHALVDTWYSRLDITNMALENLVQLTEESMDPILNIISNLKGEVSENELKIHLAS